jgi:hypothetical protein
MNTGILEKLRPCDEVSRMWYLSRWYINNFRYCSCVLFSRYLLPCGSWTLELQYIFSISEELIDRQWIISKFNFAPTQLAAEHLLKRVRSDHIYITGNTVIDAMQHTVRDDFHSSWSWWGAMESWFLLQHIAARISENDSSYVPCNPTVWMNILNVRQSPNHMNPCSQKSGRGSAAWVWQNSHIEPIEVFDCHNFEHVAIFAYGFCGFRRMSVLR